MVSFKLCRFLDLFIGFLVPNELDFIDVDTRALLVIIMNKSILPFCRFQAFLVLNFVQQVFFRLSMDGSLVITRAYPALYLGGTPSQETSTSPPSCLLLKNRLYI